MAGTRLVIHLCFLVSLLGLVAISAIVGLCLHPSDHLCRPLLLQQGRWWLYGNEAESLLRTATQCHQNVRQDESPAHSSPICPTRATVTIAVPEGQLSTWQDSDFIKVGSGMAMQVTSSKHLDSVCSSSPNDSSRIYASPYVSMADVWICDDSERPHESPPNVRSTIAMVNGSMIVHFPSAAGLRDRVAFIESMLPTHLLGKDVDVPAGDLRRPIQRQLAVTLWVGRGQDKMGWKTWFEHLRHSLQNYQHMRSLPCLAPVSGRDLATLNLRYADWTSLVQLGKDERLNETATLTNDHVIVAHQLRELLLRRQSRHGTTTNRDYSLHLMLPRTSSRIRFVPTDQERFSTGASFAQFASNEWITALDATSTDPRGVVDRAVRRWFEQVVRTCLHVPSSFSDAHVTRADGTIPTFYTKLWLHPLLDEYQSSLIEAAEQERRFIKALPWSVVVTMDHVLPWKSSLQLLSASASTLVVDARAAVARLDIARRRLVSVRYNPDLIEPPDDFPLDQYAAILAPLAMPLLLPLWFGLWREVKRYRELRDKKASARDEYRYL